MILAIDPGPTESAYVLLDKNNLKPIYFDKLNNEKMLDIIESYSENASFAIEMVASYGMSVGKEVFETVFWIGRFWETAYRSDIAYLSKVYRKDVKQNLCHSMKANDATVKQALIDRFAYGQSNHGKGTKKKPGWFYGFKSDIWSAYAVGVTYADIFCKEDGR